MYIFIYFLCSFLLSSFNIKLIHFTKLYTKSFMNYLPLFAYIKCFTPFPPQIPKSPTPPCHTLAHITDTISHFPTLYIYMCVCVYMPISFRIYFCYTKLGPAPFSLLLN